jgi:diguanylate cyclase (GGDEF)-like protein/PAS domain S-box-containing protein
MSETVRILINEDEPSDFDLAQREICKVVNDCVFQQVQTRRDFLHALNTFKPDLILSDYQMPGFDGLTALKLTQEYAKLTPFIIWTGTMGEDVAVECMKAGAVNYILKENIKRLGIAAVHALEERRLLLEHQRAAEVIENNEKRFRALIENGLDNISLLAADGTLLWESPATTRTLGYEQNEFLGHNIFQLMHPEDFDWTSELFARLVQEPGSREKGIFRLRHQDGTWRWTEAVVTNLLHEPSVRAIVINYRDISVRKRAEENLHALNRELEQRVAESTSELRLVNEQLQIELFHRDQLAEKLIVEHDLLQTLMDNIPDTIYFKDTASRFTRINHAQAKVLGIASFTESLGKTDLDFQNSELARSFYEEEQRIIQTGEPLINHVEFNPTPDGNPRWFSATKVPIQDEQGNVKGIVGVSRDITKQKQSEETLRRSEEQFRLLSWATTDAVWDWDLQTNQIQWGAGLQKVFRYPSEITETDVGWWHDHIHPEDRDKVMRSMNRALENGMEFWSKEYRFRRADGSYADIMDRGYILQNETGKPYRMIGAMLDITDRKQAEQTIRHQNEMLSGLHYITLDLLRYREVTQLLNALVEFSTAFLDASYAEIMLVDGEALVVKAVTQNQHHLLGQCQGRKDAPLSWQAFDTHEPAVLSDYTSWQQRHEVYNDFSFHAVAVFPILNDDECLGVLAVGRDKPNYEFSPDQIQFGRFFANLTALVLNNAQLRETLHEQSIRDPLTGLFNRRYMEESLKREVSRVTRQLQPMGIVMIDIDRFKRFNDTHGHAAGDALLQNISQFLQSHIRGEDIACRYGGEEFILIMPNASLDTAQQRAEHLRRAVRQLKVEDAGPAHDEITLSLGVAIYPEHGRTMDTVLRAADAALYRAKQQGRDQVAIAEKEF